LGGGLADVAAEYVRLHRVERQSLQIRSVNRVELTGLAAQAPSFKTGVSRHFFD